MDVPFLMTPGKRPYDWDRPEANGRNKRRPSVSSRVPPPMKIAADETVFRILCPASKTGGVIGKGGSIIKQFREETGSKIRIEEGVYGCDERVILIVAPEKERKGGKGPNKGKDEDGQLKDAAVDNSGGEIREEETEEQKNGPDSGKNIGSEMPTSSAQDALLRVHERILEGEFEKMSGEEADKKSSTVITRLLVPTNQVGCVLGKGGRVIERIRKESGSQIRVLPRDQLPACASSNDEVVQIIGDASAVKKALFSVSCCLRDNPPLDRGQVPPSRSGGAPLLRGDTFPQKKSLSMQGGPLPGIAAAGRADYHSRGPPSIALLPETDANVGRRKSYHEELVFRLLCLDDKVGGIIGKGGSIIRAIQSETGTEIKIAEAVADSEERVVIISAYENPESRHSPAQNAVLRVQTRIAESGPDKGGMVTARLLVPSNQIGCLLGKGGAIIAEMRKASGANIRIFGKDQVPKCASENDEVVQVTGDLEVVRDALVHITTRLRNNIFQTMPVGAGMFPSSLHEHAPPVSGPIDPYGGRHEPIGGLPHSLDRSGGHAHSIDRPGPLPPSFDRPPSPRSWPVQGIGSDTARSMSDYGRGLPQRGVGGGLGSGTQSAIVTNTTVEVVVPDHVIGSVYGENGSNLAQIRLISGAKVILHDPAPGATEGLVIISGTPEQTHAAQSLLQAFILSGQSSP
eukprot:Gb_03724 [translate_table: standard]